MKSNIHKIALFNPYLDTLGGGERYILSFLNVLEKNSYEVTVYWDKTLTSDIEHKFGLKFENLIFKTNIFKKKSLFDKINELSQYDCFFYMTDGSYFLSTAKKNYIYAMIPKRSLYPANIIDRLKTKNYSFITHSYFVQKHLKNWGIDSTVIYPYIPLPKSDSSQNKKNIILTVGRFFSQLHSKRHDKAIEVFNKLQNTQKFKDYSLVLAGGVHGEDMPYYEKIKSMAKNNPSIVLKPNISHEELIKIYTSAKYYWHFAGYDIDENLHPELVEHLGIAPLEAMSHGIIPFCYNAGGPKEIIKEGENGFLFNNEKELMNKMEVIEKDTELQKNIHIKTKFYLGKNFSYDVFKEKVLSLV